jgi:glycosyltransferase involved in cell wall biosynthesis
MKILSITAGAGGMYCGSCLRDNTLATELISLGHDVILMPAYTPTLTDEANVSQNKVLFGGISVYLQQKLPLFRKTPRWLDRLWDSSWVIKAATRFSVSTDPSELGELTTGMLEGEEGAQRKEFLKLLHWLKEHPAPDIINLPNSLLISLARPIKETWNRPVCCTLQGEDLFLDGLDEPYQKQALKLIRQNVEWVDGFIAVSDYYAKYMSDYLHIPQEKMHVVPLGIHTAGFEPAPATEKKHFTVGYLAPVAPEKGLHKLCEAYRLLHQQEDLPPLRLEVAGYLGPEHQDYMLDVERQLKEWDLEASFRYHGVLDRQQKIEFLQQVDVISVPSPYREPKGLYLFEAMACGVPVVQPRHGAFPEILERTGGGILVESDDTESLAQGIASLAKDRTLATELGLKGAEGVRAHYEARQMAYRALEVYETICRRHVGETTSASGEKTA